MKLKFENFKNCLEAAGIGNVINCLEKSKIDTDSLKEFIKKINCYQKHNKDLKVKDKMFLLKKLTRLL